MEHEQLHERSLDFLSQAFHVLSQQVGLPVRERMGSGYVYRYKERSIHQAVVQKLARIFTGLQAIRILNNVGLVQEQATLQRTLDEFEEDVAFLCFGIIFNDITDLHKEYLNAFYEEEFDNPASAIESTQKRPMIPRKKIRAFVSKDRGTGYAQSSTIEVSRTISKAYSGYVHGASSHLMELFYGSPPKFHLWGSTDSPLYSDHVQDLANYYYRSIMSFGFAAKALGNEPLFERLRYFSVEFAKGTGQESRFRETET